MQQALLVLQYPDGRKGRTVALAATRNPKALRAFRNAVIGDIENSLVLRQDEVLRLADSLELKRLRGILDLVVPPVDSR